MVFNKTSFLSSQIFPPFRERKLLASTVFCTIFLLLPYFSHSQTFNEWFRQKKTQIKYLTEQIAHLQAQIILIKKGCDIARDGWELITDFKNGEFSLHEDHFNRKERINPAIDDDPKTTINQIRRLIEASK